MKVGLFMMPSHPPERSLYDGQQWDLQVLRWADEYGYSEAWIGEHFTAPWEPNPAPDLLIAQAAMQTKNIKLATGAHLLPYHHPAELAHRAAFLDHLLQGRYMFGIGAGGLPGDWKLFNVDGRAGENREMTREATEIILQLWAAQEPFRYEGKYWTVDYPDEMFGLLRPHIKPFQKPHPPIGVASLSPNSETLKIAGERGFLPLSLNFNPAYIATHWDAIAEGAARTGRTPSRNDWRIVREVFVAETDAEARRWSAGDMMGRMMREYFIPLITRVRLRSLLKHDPAVPDEEVSPEYLVEHGWLVGSPRTVADQLARMYEDLGGFGTLLVLGFDYADNPEPWRQSMELLAKEVMPQFADVQPKALATA